MVNLVQIHAFHPDVNYTHVIGNIVFSDTYPGGDGDDVPEVFGELVHLQFQIPYGFPANLTYDAATKKMVLRSGGGSPLADNPYSTWLGADPITLPLPMYAVFKTDHR